MSFGRIACGWLISFGWIVCKWLFCLCGIVWKNITEMGRGGACVPARVALQGRIHRSSPRTMCVFLVWKRRYADVRAGTQAPPLRFRLVDCVWDGWFRLGGLRVNGYFVCVRLRGKILRGLVGAAPVCPPVSPYKGASIIQFPAHNACIFGMETPLCGRSGGHAGTAPTVSFGFCARMSPLPFQI